MGSKKKIVSIDSKKINEELSNPVKEPQIVLSIVPLLLEYW